MGTGVAGGFQGGVMGLEKRPELHRCEETGVAG